MKLFFYLLLNIYSIIIVCGIHYYGFRQICHQIVQHSLHFYDYGTEKTQITECNLVNIEINNYDYFKNNTLLELKIFLGDKQIEFLRLYKTDGLLANKNTPVYLTSIVPPINYTNFKSEYIFDTTTIHKHVPRLSDFKMYHDKSKTASIIIFRKPNSFHVEGNIGNYILRRLPYIQYLSTKYAYIRIKNNNQDEEWNNYINNTNLSYDLQAPQLNDIIINLLVVLDSTSISNTPNEVIRTLLMYFNYVDMLHSNFTSPKIRFAIKGIVLPPKENFIPYLGNNQAKTIYLKLTHIQKTIGNMYNKYNKLFKIDDHSIVAVMTQRKICDNDNPSTNDDMDNNSNNDNEENSNNCYTLDIYSDYLCRDGKYPNIIVAFHSDFQGYHGIFLDALISILGYYEETDESQKNCMGIGRDEILSSELKYPLAWSACNIEQYSNQFRKFDCSYFKINRTVLNDELQKQ